MGEPTNVTLFAYDPGSDRTFAKKVPADALQQELAKARSRGWGVSQLSSTDAIKAYDEEQKRETGVLQLDGTKPDYGENPNAPRDPGATDTPRDPGAAPVATEGARKPPPKHQMGKYETAATRGASSALGGFADELLENWQVGMDTLTGRDSAEPERAPGSDAPWSAAGEFKERLAAGREQHPTADFVGAVGGPGVRYAAMGLLPGVSAAMQAGRLPVQVGVNYALGTGESALQAAGEAEEGQRVEAATTAAREASTDPLNIGLSVAGPAIGAMRPKAKELLEKALEARLLAAGFKPGGIATLKQDLGDAFYRWAQEFEGMKFHERPAGTGRKVAEAAGLDLPRAPTSTRYAGNRATEARRAGTEGMDAVEEAATAQNLSTDPEELISAYETRVAALEKPGAPSLRQERDRWQKEADALKKERRTPSTEYQTFEHGSFGEPAAKVREPFAHALRAKRAEGQAGYDELLKGEGAMSREARIRAGLRKDQLTEALPPDLREAWLKANKQYSMGKAGEDAMHSGVTAAEVQHPRQALRDLTRATAPAQGEEKIASGIRQWALDKLMSTFGYDVRARHLMDAAQRAERGLGSRRSAAVRGIAPGTTAESIRREIERQRAASAGDPQ